MFYRYFKFQSDRAIRPEVMQVNERRVFFSQLIATVASVSSCLLFFSSFSLSLHLFPTHFNSSFMMCTTNAGHKFCTGVSLRWPQHGGASQRQADRQTDGRGRDRRGGGGVVSRWGTGQMAAHKIRYNKSFNLILFAVPHATLLLLMLLLLLLLLSFWCCWPKHAPRFCF